MGQGRMGGGVVVLCSYCSPYIHMRMVLPLTHTHTLAGESFYLRIYGKLNHNMRCTLRGYRNLMGDFTGNTIYTGYAYVYMYL
jgi:hypothetical protein